MDGKISEQKVYCKIRAQLGFPPTEIHADLQKVYGNGALKYATICKWVRRFNDGRESIKGGSRGNFGKKVVIRFVIGTGLILHSIFVHYSHKSKKGSKCGDLMVRT